MEQRLCVVRGIDHRGLPIKITVRAFSAFEAAVRGLDEILRDGGQIGEVEGTEQTPGRSWQVKPDQLVKWINSGAGSDNAGLRDIKRRVQAKLKAPTA